ncbi:MAG: DUF4236 domain-containing protein [Acidobacteria bacterium]|nr:DUF4236 domain-containing protein [Acidobacteriota bacterium]
MGFRFRKSIKIAPGLKVNLSTKGMSLTVGGQGASVNVGSAGTFLNLGLPGTGLSYRTKVSSNRRKNPATPPPPTPLPPLPGTQPGWSQQPSPPGTQPTVVPASIGLNTDSRICFYNQYGQVIPDTWLEQLVSQNWKAVTEILEREAAAYNQDSGLDLHLETPSPRKSFDLPELILAGSVPAPPEIFDFSEPIPLPPELKTPGFLGGLLKSKRDQIEAENNRLREAYVQAQREWERRRNAHTTYKTEAMADYQDQLANYKRLKADITERNRVRQSALTNGREGNPEAMEDLLGEVFKEIDWFRETTASFEVTPDAQTVWVDVDFPEIEDMPAYTATIDFPGFRLNVHPRSTYRRQKEYIHHIHSVAFRVVGEIFWALPKVTSVILSGYSQRPNAQTGVMEDQYLLSVQVPRVEWIKVDFLNLKNVDVFGFFEQFKLRRKCSRTAIAAPITPFRTAAELNDWMPTDCMLSRKLELAALTREEKESMGWLDRRQLSSLTAEELEIRQVTAEKLFGRFVAERINISRIEKGDSEEIVKAIIGSPTTTEAKLLQGKNHVTWKYAGSKPNQIKFTVNFENGVVVSWEGKLPLGG